MDTSRDPGAQIITRIASEGPRLAGRAEALLEPVLRQAAQVRDWLLDHPQRPIIELAGATTAATVTAVDGAVVRERAYVCDLIVAGAASVCLPGGDRRAASWCDVTPSSADNDRLAAAAMAACEISLAAEAGPGVWLDGSTNTPLISLARGLGARDPAVAAAVGNIITSTGCVDAAATLLADPGPVALPKADPHQEWVKWVEAETGWVLPAGDRFLATQVLRPGEALWPRPAPEAAVNPFPSARGLDDTISRGLDAATVPLARAVAEHRQLVTYVMPAAGAGTVTKVELRVPDTDPDTVRAHVAHVCATVAAYARPGIFEPVPQYLADREAKTVSLAADVVRGHVGTLLAAGGQPTLAAWLNRDYRS